MTRYFWRCYVCGWQTAPLPEPSERPTDHWARRLDGVSKICRGPFEQFEARKIA